MVEVKHSHGRVGGKYREPLRQCRGQCISLTNVYFFVSCFSAIWCTHQQNYWSGEIIFSKQNMILPDQHMRQCQIRVQFESVGMQFFKVLKKWFWMTKYVPIIVLWCSERGFYKKVTWSPVLGVLPMPQITLQCTCVYWGKLILEKILKVANIDIGFSVCYINEEK